MYACQHVGTKIFLAWSSVVFVVVCQLSRSFKAWCQTICAVCYSHRSLQVLSSIAVHQLCACCVAVSSSECAGAGLVGTASWPRLKRCRASAFGVYYACVSCFRPLQIYLRMNCFVYSPSVPRCDFLPILAMILLVCILERFFLRNCCSLHGSGTF